MGFILNLCSNILDSSLVVDISDSVQTESSTTNTADDWGYMFMPEPIAGGTENIGTLYN